MKHYGLIGNPVSHSLSAKYFNDKFALLGIDARYESILLKEIDGFPKILASYPELEGLNVTSPFKSSVIPYCNDLDTTAATIRSVNTLSIKRSGDNYHIKGYNTDADGFAVAAIPILSGKTPDALILGSGGGARAVALTLARMGLNYLIVSRTAGKGNLTYSEVTSEHITTHPLIINATPLGMPRYIDGLPEIPYEHMGKGHILFDLNYNPPTTPFLKKGRERGATTSNGLVMLQAQAEKAWHIWNAQA